MATSLLRANDAVPALLNLREYGSHRKANGLRGQSHAAVLQAIHTGRIAEPAVFKRGCHWFIDPALADKQWAVNTRSSTFNSENALSLPASEIAQPTWKQEIIEAKVKKAQSIAEREEIALKRQTGKLLHVHDVRNRWHQNAITLRDAFMKLPAALSQDLANETNPKKVESILIAKVVAILQELANA